MAKEMSRCEISHNDIGEIERGTWRKYNPYNPYVEEKDEKSVDNLDIESLDDLFNDEPVKKEEKVVTSQKEEKNELNLDDFDDAPMLPQDDDDTYDLQKELEAKFDELFGPLDDDENK